MHCKHNFNFMWEQQRYQHITRRKRNKHPPHQIIHVFTGWLSSVKWDINYRWDIHTPGREAGWEETPTLLVGTSVDNCSPLINCRFLISSSQMLEISWSPHFVLIWQGILCCFQIHFMFRIMFFMFYTMSCHGIKHKKHKT